MADALALDRAALPFPRTRLLGREAERAAARSVLLDDAGPLVTLTGPGGVGKTRLLLAVAGDVADRFADGLAWVDLAATADPALVPPVVAAALGLVPAVHRPVAEEIARHLRARQSLLLLDNCEHLLAGVADLVAGLLAACPALQVAATSRAPLHLRGERVLVVDPLPLPPSGLVSGALADNDAVRLFVERARAVRAGFALDGSNAEAVAAVCRSLDGLPLAIELAAARTAVLSPEALLAHLTERLSLLSDGPRDAPARQRTMDAAIAWSYDLLGPGEPALFRRLSACSGGFTLDLAAAVAGDGSGRDPDAVVRGVGSLVDHSLVRRQERPGEPRFAMLETIRRFGLDRLRASGEDAATRDRHAEYFLGWVRRLDAWVAPHLPDANRVLDRLETEYPNLRAALAWLGETGKPAALVELAAELIWFWQLRGHQRDGRGWLEWGLARDADLTPRARAGGQLALARMLLVQHDAAGSLALCEASLRSYWEAGDAARAACALEHAAAISLDFADPGATERSIDEALAAYAALDDAPWVRRAANFALRLRGILAKNTGDLEGADRHLGALVERQRRFDRESGGEHPLACWPLLAWGAVAHAQGNLPLALDRYQAALDHAWRFRVAQISAFVLSRVAGILAADGRWREAARLFGATEAYCERYGFPFSGAIWQLTRAFGLPQPWQGGEAYTGQAEGLRAAVLRRAPPPLPAIPDPAAAAALWEDGRGMPIAEAVAQALAVDLALPPLHPPGPRPAGAEADPGDGLTPRQREILALLCQRWTDPEIAARLYLSPRTVEGHVAQILGKLGAANRRDAAAVAARLALV